MKKLYLLLLVFGLESNAFAQYIPLPDSSARWSISHDLPYDPDSPYPSMTFGYFHELKGDTLINNISYSKIYQVDTWYRFGLSQSPYEKSGNYSNSPSILIGGLRQDKTNQKVYFRRFISNFYDLKCIQPIEELPFDEDILIFDFDAAVGDTIYLGPSQRRHIVTSIESIQFNDNLPRKKYSFGNSFPRFELIEGIGSTAGLFVGIRGLFVEGDICYLNCFTIDNEYIIGNGIYNCDSIDIVSALSESIEKPTVSISPNPFNDFLQIDLEHHHADDLTLQVYNNLGQLMIEKRLHNNHSLRLSTKLLPEGLYILHIKQAWQSLSSQLFIKN